MVQKILIVDDDSDQRRSIHCALETLCEVLEASNGREALAMIRAERPRAMLLDIAMPEMGGLAVLRDAQQLSPGMAVIMLTGELDIGVAQQALEYGARSYVTKPFDIDTLRAEVKRVLEPAKSGEADRGRPWRIAGE